MRLHRRGTSLQTPSRSHRALSAPPFPPIAEASQWSASFDRIHHRRLPARADARQGERGVCMEKTTTLLPIVVTKHEGPSQKSIKQTNETKTRPPAAAYPIARVQTAHHNRYSPGTTVGHLCLSGRGINSRTGQYRHGSLPEQQTDPSGEPWQMQSPVPSSFCRHSSSACLMQCSTLVLHYHPICRTSTSLYTPH